MSVDPELHTHDSTKPVLTTTEARQAVPRGVINVLVISLILVVAAFTAIYFW
jgi:hypothetical protein